MMIIVNWFCKSLIGSVIIWWTRSYTVSFKIKWPKKVFKKASLYSSVPNRRACTFINFEEKFPPARPYLGLHDYWFWEKIPPARSYFGLHDYWFWEKIPTCTFISSCTSIRYTRVSMHYENYFLNSCEVGVFGTLVRYEP